MNKIRQYFVKKCKLLKSNSAIPYACELTVFINVKIDNLKELSKLIPFRVKKHVNVKREITKIKILKKYLFISSKLKLIFVNRSLFIKIFFGLLNERIWFREYLNNEYIFINLKPELVEKKEPPIITKIKNTKFKLVLIFSKEKPILDMLDVKAKKLIEKSLLKLKKKRKIPDTNNR